VRKHPLFVLYMTLNPELIDINVHPQKKEVRFKEEALVKEVIRKAVGKALQGEGRKEVAQISPLKVAPSKSLEEILEKKPQNPKEFCGFNVKNKPELTKVQEDLLPWEVPMLPKVEDVEVLGLHRHYLWLEAGSAEKVLCPPYIKGGEGGLFVVDLKAGLSRIYFEKVGSETQLGLQALLFPKTFRVATQEVVYFMEALPSLEKLGIQMRAFGESTFLIEACHKDIEEDKLEDTLYELLEEMKKGERGDMERRLALKVASRVGRRKMRFELAEAKGILSQLLKTAQPYFCPFGKKTIAHMSMQYYDKLFI
ncbi:MAG: hypothetical protein FJZ63_07185, partial [Chlamydiae bacterium]|nr:hypothetical protein [Chlamydiota bacterium]